MKLLAVTGILSTKSSTLIVPSDVSRRAVGFAAARIYADSALVTQKALHSLDKIRGASACSSSGWWVGEGVPPDIAHRLEAAILRVLTDVSYGTLSPRLRETADRARR